jgi:hypothetical protein
MDGAADDVCSVGILDDQLVVVWAWQKYEGWFRNGHDSHPSVDQLDSTVANYVKVGAGGVALKIVAAANVSSIDNRARVFTCRFREQGDQFDQFI